MALTEKSLFLYGFEVTKLNQNLPFRAVAFGPQLNAVLTLGFYSLTSIMAEVKRAMQAADPSNEYTVTADRTVNSGLENRVTIVTDGVYLDLLFLTGTTATSSCRTLIGFSALDRTGFLTYTGNFTAGTALIPEYNGYNYLSPDFNHKVYGNVNVSASGIKEAVVFQIQKFFQVQFKYEPSAKWITEWTPFFDWAIQQRLLEFTPEISSPSVFYEGTLERTGADGKGLAIIGTEMLPQFPFNHETGLLMFRQNQ